MNEPTNLRLSEASAQATEMRAKPRSCELRCSCKVARPRRESAAFALVGKYVWRVDEIHDNTEFDPACPFHGENGTMVAVVGGVVE